MERAFCSPAAGLGHSGACRGGPVRIGRLRNGNIVLVESGFPRFHQLSLSAQRSQLWAGRRWAADTFWQRAFKWAVGWESV